MTSDSFSTEVAFDSSALSASSVLVELTCPAYASALAIADARSSESLSLGST